MQSDNYVLVWNQTGSHELNYICLKNHEMFINMPFKSLEIVGRIEIGL